MKTFLLQPTRKCKKVLLSALSSYLHSRFHDHACSKGQAIVQVKKKSAGHHSDVLYIYSQIESNGDFFILYTSFTELSIIYCIIPIK